jgi:hypothetical protein
MALVSGCLSRVAHSVYISRCTTFRLVAGPSTRDSGCHGRDVSLKTISKTSTQLKRSRYILFFFFFFFINKAKKLQSGLIRQDDRVTLLFAFTYSCVGYWRSHLRFLSNWKKMSVSTPEEPLDNVCHLFPVYSMCTIARRDPQDLVLILRRFSELGPVSTTRLCIVAEGILCDVLCKASTDRGLAYIYCNWKNLFSHMLYVQYVHLRETKRIVICRLKAGSRRSFLGNDSVNRFPRKRISKQQ